ncbi:MAG: Hsp20/alpha crystallin family protein [Deltaproteobacteria bacterium]|nr:Hsp20/alpha crystallin family protein [Deltaproteobacteria bacterium]
MAITRWDPLSELRNLSHRMERAFAPFQSFGSFEPLRAVEEESWPNVDVYEDKEEVVFRAELPGIEQKDVEVVLEDSTLTIRGERKLFNEEKRENYRRIETGYGAFSRSFALPSTIDRDKLRAEMKKGVLEVHVPKREGAKGKNIPISG